MFEGFSTKTGEFLWDLKFNNERPWFLEHKGEFEKYVKEPFDELGNAVHDEMQRRFPEREWRLHISRIYRDARRLYGRGPYKDHLWFTIWDGEPKDDNPAFWFEIGPSNFGYGAGFYAANPEQMEKYRAYIDANPAEIIRLDAELTERNQFVLAGEMYKKMKGDRGEVLNRWYNRRWLAFDYGNDHSEEIYVPEFVQTVSDGYEFLMPYYELMRKFK